MAVAQDQRPEFYQGQYLGPEDLTAAVDYGRIEFARHNLGAHSWGIAIGMNLVEKPSPLGNNQVDVFLNPGYAWDGFGRAIVVLAPAKISASLFQNLVYDPAVDGGNPAGRLVQVWAQYTENPNQPPASGFQTCSNGNANARVQETFQVVAGSFTNVSDQRDPVTIGAKAIDAQQALSAFDSTAPPLYDASVPQQALPEDDPTALWLIPLGYVRWLPPQNATQQGSFQQKNAQDISAGEALRTYIGVIAGAVLGAGPNVRVRARGTQPSAVSSNDLLWVEGSLRVDGDTNLFGGELTFLDPAGQNNGGIPLSIQRFDQPAAPGPLSSLQVVIGASNKGKNSFAVGPLDPNNKNAFVPKLSIFDNGNVGIGTITPDALVSLQSAGGTYLTAKDSSDSVEVLLGADINGGIVSTLTNHDLILRAGGNQDKMILKVNGFAGLGIDTPTNNLHVAGIQGIRQNYLYMSGDVGGSSFTYNAHRDQFNANWIFPDPSHCAVTIEIDDNLGNPRFEVYSTTPNAKTSWIERLHVDGATGNTFLALNGGNVGIGAAAATGRLSVTSSVAAQGTFSIFTANEDIAYDGGSDQLFLLRALGGAATSFMGGRVGINTTAPVSTLDVAGDVTANNYNNHSDARLKCDIQPLTAILDKLLKLRGVRFRWKDEAAMGGRGLQMGLIAQEVETVFPEWVTEDAAGYKLLARSGFDAVVIEAIRELKTQLDALKASIEESSDSGEIIARKVNA